VGKCDFCRNLTLISGYKLFLFREHAPSIIFMDEIDSIGSSRIESGSGGDSEVQRTMLELLNQLDGFEATKNIKVCHSSEMGPTSTTENVRILKKCCTK